MTKGFLRRGRPSNGQRSRTDRAVLETLARMAARDNIEPSLLFRSIVESLDKEEMKCKNIVIRCRKKTRHSAIFLFTRDQKVIAQFPIPYPILREEEPLKDYIRRTLFKVPVRKPEWGELKIKDLRVGMRGIDLKARVVEIPSPNIVYTTFGRAAYVSNVLIADKTGTIRLSLWNRQIKRISVNDLIQISKGRVCKFRSERQLRIGRNGKLSIIHPAGYLLKNEQRS